jgi:hypothetical protein
MNGRDFPRSELDDSRRKTMLRKTIFLSVAATLAALLTAPEARAWGGFHVGYTHVGYGGVQHWGRTAVEGPYGAYSGGHYGAYGRYGGSYRAGYGGGYRSGYGEGYGGYHSYSAYGATGGYGYGGYHYGGAYGGGYNAGVYRSW